MAGIVTSEIITTPAELDAQYRALRAEVGVRLGLTGKRFKVASDAIRLWIDFGRGDWVGHSRGLDTARDVVRMYSNSEHPAKFKITISY